MEKDTTTEPLTLKAALDFVTRESYRCEQDLLRATRKLKDMESENMKLRREMNSEMVNSRRMIAWAKAKSRTSATSHFPAGPERDLAKSLETLLGKS